MLYRRGGFREVDPRLLEYTSSSDVDAEIADEVVFVMISHVVYLSERGLVPGDAAKKALRALLELRSGKKKLELSKSYEDVHEALEAYLLKEVGEAVGYVSLGRSRNDHVAAAIRLKLAKRMLRLAESVCNLRSLLLDKAEEHLETPFPLHTHFQPAQAVTYGHYLMAVEEELGDAVQCIMSDLQLVLKSPLGAAAGAGTSVPIDRAALAKQTGFVHGLVCNSIYATSSRTFFLRALSPLLMLAAAYTRVATDFFLWSHPALGYVELSERHIQTSSIMPHKRNPATLEVLRARCSSLAGLLASVFSVEAKLPTGYNLDLQEATGHVWKAFDILEAATEVLADAIASSRPVPEACERALKAYVAGLTEAAEALSLAKKEPYRSVHLRIASLLRERGWSAEEVLSALASELGEEVAKLSSPRAQLEAKATVGSPNPSLARECLARARSRLEEHKKALSELSCSLEFSVGELLRKAEALAGGVP